jgi:hypothetical protein
MNLCLSKIQPVKAKELMIVLHTAITCGTCFCKDHKQTKSCMSIFLLGIFVKRTNAGRVMQTLLGGKRLQRSASLESRPRKPYGLKPMIH